MARLPTPGSDDGTWGDILNAYLSVSHFSDGTLNANVVGTSQLADNAVTNAKLDTATQTTIASVASKYVKPAGGIPSTDMTSAVQTSLGKADTSVQNTQLGAASGVATLDSGSKLTSSQLPATVALMGSANTFTQEQTVSDLKVTGLTGATAASRYVGATASGSPSTGTFAAGDFVVDQSGTVWVCTTAGTPGTWATPQQGVELGYAEITADTQVQGTTFTDITGLSTTVTVGSRPIAVEMFAPVAACNVSNALAYFRILEDGTEIIRGGIDGASSAIFLPMNLRKRRAPSAGSHTYKAQFAASTASAFAQLFLSSYGAAFISVTQR